MESRSSFPGRSPHRCLTQRAQSLNLTQRTQRAQSLILTQRAQRAQSLNLTQRAQRTQSQVGRALRASRAPPLGELPSEARLRGSFSIQHSAFSIPPSPPSPSYPSSPSPTPPPRASPASRGRATPEIRISSIRIRSDAKADPAPGSTSARRTPTFSARIPAPGSTSPRSESTARPARSHPPCSAYGNAPTSTSANRPKRPTSKPSPTRRPATTTRTSSSTSPTRHTRTSGRTASTRARSA